MLLIRSHDLHGGWKDYLYHNPQLLNIESFEGYQIQVKAENKDSIVIHNKLDGTETQSVYKDGTMNLAVMTGNLKAGDFEVCDIVAQYPFSDRNKERVLNIEEIQAVTSITLGESCSG